MSAASVEIERGKVNQKKRGGRGEREKKGGDGRKRGKGRKEEKKGRGEWDRESRVERRGEVGRRGDGAEEGGGSLRRGAACSSSRVPCPAHAAEIGEASSCFFPELGINSLK